MELSISESPLDRQSRLIIGLVALIQGLALYWLHYALDNTLWPSDDWPFKAMLLTFWIIVPTGIVISYRSDYPTKPYWSCIALLATLLLWIAWYGSHQISQYQLSRDYYFYINLVLLLSFMALFFLKASMRDGRFIASYTSLFGFSWHNFLSFSLACLFTVVFWLILMLWGGLFKIVDIDFFAQLFKEEWFFYPVLSLAFAYAVIIFRTKINAVGALQRILRALISILLPLLLGIAVMFVAVLPFTGVNLIWSKGYGSDIIIGFVSLSLFFFNAVYQDAKVAPYDSLLNKIVQYSIVVLLALLALSAYGVSLRIAQYGLTVERILAVILIAIMFCYVISYTLIIVIKSESWSEYFGKANTLMAILVCLIIVLMFTPILNLSKLAIDSQLARLERGDVSLEEFDFKFLARNGSIGMQELKKLKRRDDVQQSEDLVILIDKVIETKGRSYYSKELSQEMLEKTLTTYPQNSVVEDSFWAYLKKKPHSVRRCLKSTCALLKVDLNSDSEYEYILFFKQKNFIKLQYYVQLEDGVYQNPYTSYRLSMSFDELTQLLESDSFSLVSSKWLNLKIGDEIILTPRN